MERNFGLEIDELRRDLELLKQGRHNAESSGNRDQVLTQFYGLSEEQLEDYRREMEKQGKKIPEWGIELARTAVHRGFEGGIARFAGIFKSPGDEGFMWNMDCSTADLLSIDDTIIEKVLVAMGHRMRIRLLKEILNQPSTAAGLVERLHLKTTGKAYHHLNLLESADLICKDEGGRYHVRGHRVSVIFAALLSVHGTIDNKYSGGSVHDLPDSAEGE